MCGIIGINSKSSNVIESVITGLKNLEYRGYDSAGIAGNSIQTIKTQGKISALEAEVAKQNLQTNLAIGHTRWATHGAATQINAHPHQTSQVSVVHNGIIENYISLKLELTKAGHVFASQTDSEVIPHLITLYLNQGQAPLDAVNSAVKRLEGAFSIAVIFNNFPSLMIAARKGSPLVVGYGENQMIIASDAYALAFLTNKITYLEEGDVAILYSDKIEIYNNQESVERSIIVSENNITNIGKGNFCHYMLKEIFDQPSIIADTINAYDNLHFPNLTIDFNKVSKITLVACGSSYYTAMTSKYWLEEIVSIPVEIDIASEFRYRNSYLPENGLCIFLSQSGETADTLAALRYAKQKKQKTLSIINVHKSSLDREADFSLQCFAGQEVSVASTKGFTTQLVVLLLLSLHIGHQIGKINKEELSKKLQIIAEVPGRIAENLNSIDSIKTIAKDISSAKNAIFIGRNYMYPIALEGALKLKELSYIHAEAIAAGELKHGPIALIDEEMPIIVLAPQNSLFEKTISNAQEIAARGGKLITLSSSDGNDILKSIAKHQLNISNCDSLIEPIIYALPMQLLAYYVAVIKGTDVDQPRNLAKSVTVE
jgi:glucosamine--fructose-6-phosphate aminotransferase (isomerizing)